MPVVADMTAGFYTENFLEMTEMLWFTGEFDYFVQSCSLSYPAQSAASQFTTM
jgi:hypothetical protein